MAEETERLLAAAEAGRAAKPVHLTLQQIAALSGDWYRAALADQERDPQDEEQYGLLLDEAER